MKVEKFLFPLILLLIWQGLSSAGLIPAYKLPSPLEILSGLGELLTEGMPPGQRLHNHILYSLYRVGLGFAAAAILAVPLGLVMGWSDKIRRFFRPVLEVIRPVPPLAWIPIAILWFGIGIPSAAFIIFLGAFFPILLNTVSGVLSINPTLVEAARTLKAQGKDIFFKVLFPGAIPAIFVGLRIAIGIAWMTLVAAEFTGVREGYGLGYMIMTARDIQRPDKILAGMLVIGVIGLLIDMILRKVEARVIPWK
jgi:ABC-type nitrate/sulfonate/bicarbonate transport system permease component